MTAEPDESPDDDSGVEGVDYVIRPVMTRLPDGSYGPVDTKVRLSK